MMGYIKTKEEVIEQVQAKIADLDKKISVKTGSNTDQAVQYELALSNLYIALAKLYTSNETYK